MARDLSEVNERRRHGGYERTTAHHQPPSPTFSASSSIRRTQHQSTQGAAHRRHAQIRSGGDAGCCRCWCHRRRWSRRPHHSAPILRWLRSWTGFGDLDAGARRSRHHHERRGPRTRPLPRVHMYELPTTPHVPVASPIHRQHRQQRPAAISSVSPCHQRGEHSKRAFTTTAVVVRVADAGQPAAGVGARPRAVATVDRRHTAGAHQGSIGEVGQEVADRRRRRTKSPDSSMYADVDGVVEHKSNICSSRRARS